LQKLPQKHEQNQSQKRPNAAAEKPTAEKKNAQSIKDKGAGNEQGIGGRRVLSQIGIQARSEIVQRVSNTAGSGRPTRAEQGLRPEPNPENNSH
jgi:hypothetical protein